MDDHELQRFVDSAMEELDRKDQLLRDTYGLGSLGRWWFDQAARKLQFFDMRDKLAVEADVVTIGSFAPESNSWRWAWANETALPEMRRLSDPLRDLAQMTGFDVFSQEHAFQIDSEGMAWELVAISVRHLSAFGGYRIPSANRPLYTYLAIMDIRHVAA